MITRVGDAIHFNDQLLVLAAVPAALLTELAAQGGGRSLDLAKFARPSLLAIDEVRYLSSPATPICCLRSSPDASDVVARVDRVVHRAEVVVFKGGVLAAQGG